MGKESIAVTDSINTMVLILGRLHERSYLKYVMMLFGIGLTGIQIFFGSKMIDNSLEKALEMEEQNFDKFTLIFACLMLNISQSLNVNNHIVSFNLAMYDLKKDINQRVRP